MFIYVLVKSVGKRRDVVSKQRVKLQGTPGSLRVLLTELVTVNVREFVGKEEEKPLVSYLTEGEINQQASSGKVGFGAIYNNSKPDLNAAIHTAIQAFEDGLFLVFINSEQIEDLDAPLNMADGDEVALIRLTMLAGRMW
ncbi:hypothetical protein EJA10_03340 [Mesobacillus subterraneus]|uniref:Uncharacterized protein n=2 Tax=Mesobacillus subterraneus TaxID=285983 RepID=A0A3R9DWC2_9BACI|nr:hypothetical protein EJA10_03340 [Mesobacillus subterraneus]